MIRAAMPDDALPAIHRMPVRRHLSSLFHHTDDAVCLAAADGRIVDANPAAAARFGAGAGAPAHLRDLFAEPADWDGLSGELAAGAEVHRRPVRLRGPAGEPSAGALTCVRVEGAGAPEYHAIVHAAADGGGSGAAARFDPATGLPSRAALVARLQAALASPDRSNGSRIALIQVDLNRFQRINEALGHDAGDEVLSKAAQRLDACVRPQDVVARSEGDDFLVMLNGVRGAAEAVRVAERIGRALAGGYKVEGHELFCGSDVGLAVSDGADAEALLRAAEAAMSRSRATGRVELFRQEMHVESTAALRMDAELRRAIERDELRVFYQPIVDLRDGRVRGFEALVRWEHPERGLVSPAEFIPIAEETGLIVPMGAWVLDRAAAQLREWQARHPSQQGLAMGVNLSVRQFRPALVDEVRAVLDRSGVDAAGLKLEVTESVVMGSADEAVEVLHDLKGLGIKLQVDDFGTGYSSLAYLHRLPLDILKIDRSFIVAMAQGDRHQAIVRAIIALADTLGLQTTAEGVDSVEQAGLLHAMRCTYGQGYLWSRPVPAEQAEAMIGRRLGGEEEVR
ncbi:MAG TPA: bifunctional diguanylate cyclase/phosphodiesterase [Longimicrobium sp.]|jgi:diguanylate cyclase (GGDEF)-like protein|uniref:putative bifunctional diguanylate cyclase/phosphodiesterase n=1 Tax=Longimicrobium sp. TaxID=2029185 RepID=UPI002ED7B2D2